MMKIYKVEYRAMDLRKYFGGYNNYYTTKEEYFTTEEKAKDFVAKEITEYITNWGKDTVIKEKNQGTIIEIKVK